MATDLQSAATAVGLPGDLCEIASDGALSPDKSIAAATSTAEVSREISMASGLA
jgi:hypothetical protein